MTDMDTAAGEVLRRRLSGGREGHARSALPQQRPWSQPRMRYRPTEAISADELESIHAGSLRVLSEIGMDFLDADARDLLVAAGATVDPASGISGFKKLYSGFSDLAPLRANITPEDVGRSALYLASDSASAVTGETLYVDGGFNIMGVPTSD